MSNPLAAFLIGLVGQPAAPLADSARRTTNAFKDTGGDVAKMRRPKRARRPAPRFGLGRRLANLAFASKEFVPRRWRKRLSRPFEGWQKSTLGQTVTAGREAFADVGGYLARASGADKAYQRGMKAFRPGGRRALKSLGKSFRRRDAAAVKGAKSRQWGARWRPEHGHRTLAQAVTRMFRRGEKAPLPPKVAPEGPIEYKHLIANMANPNAMAEAKHEPPPQHTANAEKAAAAKRKEEDAQAAVVKGLIKYGGTVGVVTTVTVGLLPAIKKFGETVTDANRELADYSGNIATSFAKLDIEQFRLKLMTAQGVEGSTSSLNEAYAEFSRALQPLEQEVTTLLNFVSKGILQFGTKTAGVVREVLLGLGLEAWAKHLEEIEKNTRPDNTNRGPTGRLIKALESGQFVRPPHLPLGKF